MYKAYDTILQTEVSAGIASRTGSFEQYRYECACCGEEVFVAAPNSTHVSAHFRHRSGNNDVDCENYLGHSSTLIIGNSGRHSNKERVEFYYNNNTKLFYVGIRYSSIDITKYEEQNAILKISISSRKDSFFEIPINNRYFIPDVPYKVPLDEYSSNFFIWNSIDNVKRPYEFINNSGFAFFKLMGSEVEDYEAKLVRGNVLFTGIRYFSVIQNCYFAPKDFNLPSEMSVEETIRFKTMNRYFLGKVLYISMKTSYIEGLCHSWGYQLDASESLSVLWPPISIENEICVTSKKYVFLHTSFALQSHGNINTHSRAFDEISSALYKIEIESQIKIYKKNAEITIVKNDKTKRNYETLKYSERTANVFMAPKSGNNFLFSAEGVVQLKEGQEIPMLVDRTVKCYLSNYLIETVISHKQPQLTVEELLKDILLHYKNEESFDPDCFNGFSLSKTVCQYIKICQSLGRINSAVKRYILEGVL